MSDFVLSHEAARFRTLTRFAALLSGLLAMAAADETRGQQQLRAAGLRAAALRAADGFWDRTVAEAIKASAEGARWVLVYFPSPTDRDDPPQITAFPPPGAPDGLFVGARVRAKEVTALLKKYKVEEFPALVLLDPYGALRRRWEERWSVRDVVRGVTVLDRQLRKLLREIDRKVTAAASSFDEKKYAESISLCSDVVAKAPRGPARIAARERALALARKILEVANGELIEVLAKEGLIADSELEKNLIGLETRFPGLLPFERRLAREKARLKGRKIGG